MSGLAFDRLARDWAAALDAQASHDLAAQLAACDRRVSRQDAQALRPCPTHHEPSVYYLEVNGWLLGTLLAYVVALGLLVWAVGVLLGGRP